MRRRLSRLFAGHGRDRIFALIADVEAYPEFLPFCRRVEILARGEGFLRVAQEFGAGALVLRFETEAWLSPPEALRLRSRDAAFRRFRVDWRFIDEAGGCRVDCEMEAVFRHPALEMASHVSAAPALAAVVAAFARRAAETKPDEMGAR